MKMEIAENTVAFILFSIVGFYILMIAYFTIEHRLIRCTVKVPEYKKEHSAENYMEALDWVAQYPSATQCLIYNQGKLIGTRG